MKLVLRILPTVFVLISITAFADALRTNLNANVDIVPNLEGDNVGVTLFGQGVSITVFGGTPAGWFDAPGGPTHYFPGDSGLGPTTITWDGGQLQIGSTLYDFDQFEIGSGGVLDVPSITFPTNGKDFTVTVAPFVWELAGTIDTNCPSSGCNFDFLSKPGELSFSFFFGAPSHEYFASSASFSTPEPGTLGLMAAGLAGILGVFSRRKRPHPQRETLAGVAF
jgi:hypothetical protein